MARATIVLLSAIFACHFFGCSPSASDPDSAGNAPGQSSSADPNSKNELADSSESTPKSPTRNENAPKKTNGPPSEAPDSQRPSSPAKDANSALAVKQKSGPAAGQKSQSTVNNPDFHEALVGAANQYLEFAMVNSVAIAAPRDCAPASDPDPKFSLSDDQDSHGEKLYFLFTNKIAHYLSQDGTPSPVGQVLVKEAWTSKPSNLNARNSRNHSSGIRINPRTKVGDQVLEIGRRSNLFVMLKMEADTPATDQGWVYGVVDPESKVVSESGKIPSCIQCHQDAKHDRLFGTSILPH